jgi:phosphate transport system permease protein
MRKLKDGGMYGLIGLSVTITISTLLLVLGFVFVNGMSMMSLDFIFGPTESSSSITTFAEGNSYDFSYEVQSSSNENTVVITEVREYDDLEDKAGDKLKLVEGDTITEVDDVPVKKMSIEQIDSTMSEIQDPTVNHKVKVTDTGGGIFPLIITTLYVIFFSLLFAIPFGLFAAIYLVEYKVNPRLNDIIHFAIDSLAGIPSIIFGLFGYMFFSITLGFGISLLSGILTTIIMLLPIVIKTIEEALIAVPDTLRESSYGLGATKAQTIFKVVLPSALPGIIVSIILATSRVIGESAIFIFAAGTTAQLPKMFEQGATLTVYAYSVTNEFNDVETATAVAIVIIVMVLILNIGAKLASRKINGGN